MITENILTGLISFLAPVVAIALVIFCVIQGFKLLKGSESGSVGKLVMGALLILFILGIMYLAGSYETYGELFKGLTGDVVSELGDNAGTIIGGGDGGVAPAP